MNIADPCHDHVAARALAREIDRVLDRPLDLAGILGRALDRTSDCSRSSRAVALVDNLVVARRLAHSFADSADPGRMLSEALTLTSVLGRARLCSGAVNFAEIVGDANDPTLTLTSVLDLASGLDRALDHARSYANDLVSSLPRIARAADAQGPGPARQVASSAAGLLAVVARLLPAADRGRYDEEFRSELWDLAQAGAGRLRQVAYALRQLCCARLTVSALRSPRRKSAVP